MRRRPDSGRHGTSRARPGRKAISDALKKFYLEVAHTLDLPAKSLPVATPPDAHQTRGTTTSDGQAKPAQSAHTRWWIPALAMLVLVALSVYHWWPAGEAVVPTAFQGTWVSRDASYAGRMIVLSMETVEIVAGGSSATGPVAVRQSKVDTTAEGVRLRLVFETADDEQTLEMTLHVGRPATLTLLRPPGVVWERLEDLPASRPGDAVPPDSSAVVAVLDRKRGAGRAPAGGPTK